VSAATCQEGLGSLHGLMLFDLTVVTETLGSPMPTASRLETAGTLHGHCLLDHMQHHAACCKGSIGRNACNCFCSPLFLSGHLHSQHQYHAAYQTTEALQSHVRKATPEKEKTAIECE